MSVVLEPIPRIMPAVDEPNSQIIGTVVLRLPVGFWSDEEFLALCKTNESLRLEKNRDGDLVIMNPGDMLTSFRNNDFGTLLNIWNRQTNRGYVSDSSGMVKLPNGAQYAPDAAWILRERWDALTPEQQSFPAEIAPDFVLELMSPSDRLSDGRAKMREYLENGVRLGWLINPKAKQVEIYETGKAPVVLDDPKTVSGEPVLSGFTLDLAEIWK